MDAPQSSLIDNNDDDDDYDDDDCYNDSGFVDYDYDDAGDGW